MRHGANSQRAVVGIVVLAASLLGCTATTGSGDAALRDGGADGTTDLGMAAEASTDAPPPGDDALTEIVVTDGAAPDAGLEGGCTSAGDCADGIDCTDDTCGAGQCVHTVVPARCSAGSSCDLHRGCVVGRACATSMDCADMDPCTTNERCDRASRTCLFDLLDGDGDGHPPRVCGGGDCDDSNPSVHPGAPELCNGRDDNCDGRVDEAPAGSECDRGQGHHACSAGVCLCSPTTPLECGDSCFDPMTSVTNCGGCGHACGRSTSTGDGGLAVVGGHCVGGTCQCDAGYLLCGEVCVDTQSDPNNCGTCGASCPTIAACTGGSCRCRVSGQTLCGMSCVDTTTDTMNCGACGNWCLAGAVCAAGSCQCPSGQTLCTGLGCYDLQSGLGPMPFCGTCGHYCAPGTPCYRGICGCPAGLTTCSGFDCNDLQTNARNCGRCGQVCPMGSTCVAGHCS